MQAVVGIVLKAIVTELVIVPIVQLKVLVLLAASVAGVVLLLVLVVVLALVSQKAFVPIVAVVPGMPINGIGMQVEQEPIILPVLLAHFTSTMLQELLPPRFMTAVQLALFGISFLGTKLFKPTPTSPLKSEPQTLPF